MAQHVRGDGEGRSAASKRSSLLASAQSAQAAQRQRDTTTSSRRVADDAAQDMPRVSRDARYGQRAQYQPESKSSFIRRNILYIASVAAVVAIAMITLGAVRSCTTPGQDKVESGANVQETYVSPYDWSKLDHTNGRYAYVVDGKVKSRLGVDVSENQHAIDWGAVAADGIDFAIIRLGYRGATEGGMYLDEYYQDNLAGAKAAGLDCGVYFFSQAKTVKEAVEEADFVLENLGGVALEYPIAFDSEEAIMGVEESRTTDLENEEMTAIAEAFCNRVEQAGYRSIVYGNYYDMSRYHYENMQDHDLWWAEYDVPSPTAQIDIVMWQYATDIEVAGISTGADMNIDLSGVLK